MKQNLAWILQTYLYVYAHASNAPSCGQWLCGSKFGLRGSSSIRYLDKEKSRVERTEVAP
ncbi:hypothetical protein T4E_5107 [Trichinella pseudospiralis]|uniref:Uncharacterized protein n=1 Tax=Trichinella pseudospiralis TaxID=6337 RepID=A0A0V0XGJ0_TRIPS|nr:hypothetical protein T4E_9203 [Trichinella pseudospiralis]KRX87483.1 hypothetical protein T4E_5107 [Trichinella pseudospiralis]